MKKRKQRKSSVAFALPSVGDIIYLPSMLYLTHGVDDFHGGKCRISRVIHDSNPQDPYVEVEEWPGVRCRYQPLLEEQKQLKAEYGDTVGHCNPDFRPEFNDDPTPPHH